MAASTNRRGLRVESLEAKQLLAGDVAVSVVNGALVIEGDELGNQIAITSGETAGSYVITGLDGTTVTLAGAETPGAAVTVEGVRRDVRIGLGGGDDSVRIDDAQFRGSVRIATGEGNDRVLVGVGPESSVGVGGGLSVATGVGDDSVTIARAELGRLNVATGEGADDARLGAEATATSDGDTATGDGNGAEANVDGSTPAALRAQGVLVELGEGDDSLVANSVEARRVTAAGGAGADTFRLTDLSAGGIAVIGGPGDAADEVFASGVNAREMTVETGNGADTVRILDSAFGLLAVALGDGDDALALEGVAARGATLLGGAGEADRYRDLGGNTFGRMIQRGFEAPPETSGEAEATV